jgi:gas vesicle protein
MNNEDGISTSTVLLAFTGGALLGAGLTLLFAPQSGQKTRQQIGGLAEDAEEYAQELAHKAARSMRKACEKGERMIGQAEDFVAARKS